jgi:hypothetical protein
MLHLGVDNVQRMAAHDSTQPKVDVRYLPEDLALIFCELSPGKQYFHKLP